MINNLRTVLGALINNDTVNLPEVGANSWTLANILNIVWIVSASLAVLFVAIGGFKYTMSNGDPNQISSAKNTIVYALIGLVIAMAAFAIVNFVLGKV